jgi:hypothetical protein
MKKILVVLLILSVAWGVFAQDGSWRVSGNVEVGTRLNFDPTPGDDDTTNDAAKVTGKAYYQWDSPRGRFALIYGTFVNDGALSTGFKWNTRGAEENEPFFSYNGENFSFSTSLYGTSLLVSGREGSYRYGGEYIHRLWGNYKFVNGLVFIQAAYRAEEEEFWISDTTAGGSSLDFAGGGAGSARGTETINNAGFFGKPSTFTYNDGGNYLLGDIRLSAISFGVMIPRILAGNENYYTGNTSEAARGENKYGIGQTGGYLLGDEVLKESIIGVKFSMAPIEFAGQFKIKSAGTYIGAKFFAGPVTVGASFSGIFNPDKWPDPTMVGTTNIGGTYKVDKFFKVGGDVNFNGGVFAAGLAASMEKTSDPSDSSVYTQFIRVQPRFSYNVIPSHLCFALDAGFYFYTETDGTVTSKDTTWAVQPALYWTFLGTGARNGYGWTGPFYQGGPTGIIARYRVVSAGADWRDGAYNSGSTPVNLGGWSPMNALDIVFQFNF